MDSLERFKKICSFERKNDVFFYSIDSWNEAYDRWVLEGMPVKNLSNKKELNMHLLGINDRIEWLAVNSAIYGAGKNNNPPWIVSLDPLFDQNIISETSSHVIQRECDGTIVERKKGNMQSIPRYIDFPVKDKKSWDNFKTRLDPFSKGRWPENWDIMTDDKMQFPLSKELEGKHYKYRDFPLAMILLSLYGNIRNYMGLEGVSFAIYEQPKLIEEMLEWQTYLAYEVAKKVISAGIVPNIVYVWEDMCYKNGSLISPEFVKKFMVPRYKKITELLRNAGVDVILVDCDGNIDELLPYWIESGINATWPLECASNMDARKVRIKYGKDIILFGNVDKMKLAGSKSDIDEEVNKVKELIKYGGFFVSADHFIPPDVPYENLKYWINETRKLTEYPETYRLVP